MIAPDLKGWPSPPPRSEERFRMSYSYSQYTPKEDYTYADEKGYFYWNKYEKDDKNDYADGKYDPHHDKHDGDYYVRHDHDHDKDGKDDNFYYYKADHDKDGKDDACYVRHDEYGKEEHYYHAKYDKDHDGKYEDYFCRYDNEDGKGSKYDKYDSTYEYKYDAKHEGGKDGYDYHPTQGQYDYTIDNYHFMS
jgi:hypothetical protein